MTSRPAEIGARLARLSETVHPRGRGPYTDAEITASITAGEDFVGQRHRPVPLTVEDLAELRAGRTTPRATDQLSALADSFGVPASYLIDGERAAEIDDELRLLALLRDRGIRNFHVCTRAGGQPSARDLITLLEYTQREQAERNSLPPEPLSAATKPPPVPLGTGLTQPTNGHRRSRWWRR